MRLHPLITRYLNEKTDADGGGMTPEEQQRQIEAQVDSNPRVVAMDEIAQRNAEARRAEMAADTPPPTETPEPTPEPTPQPTAAPSPAVDLSQLTAQLQAGTPVPMELLDNITVTVKVDGRDEVRPLRDYRRGVQLDGAAQQRLDQANRLLEEARAAADRIKSGAVPAAAPPVGSDTSEGGGNSAITSKDVAAETKQLVDALLVGDETAATEALGRILQRSQPAQQIDEGQLVSKLVPAVKQQLSVEEATAKFTQDYSDIVGDPFLASVADGHLDAILKKDPQKPFAEALQDAGKATREWLTSKGVTSPAPVSQPAQTQQQLEVRQSKSKESIDNVGGLGARATTQPPEPQTASDVIREMRKARGLEV